MQLDAKALASATADIVRRHVETATAPLLRRIDELESFTEHAQALRDAEHRAFLAEQRETVAALIRKAEERLASVKDGKDGERGEKGDQGPPGERGEQGVAGVDGRDGANGRDGQDADMEALERRLEELVAAIPVPKDGKDGKDAYPGEVRGVFSDEEAYRARDIVKFDGSSWIAKVDEPGPIPGDGWMQLASKGKRGDRGEKGDRGTEGKPGNDGAQPVALKFEADDMKFVMVLDDGNMLEADFYPVAKAIRGEGH